MQSCFFTLCDAVVAFDHRSFAQINQYVKCLSWVEIKAKGLRFTTLTYCFQSSLSGAKSLRTFKLLESSLSFC